MSSLRASILISRRHLRPHAGLPWVVALQEAVAFLRENEFRLLTSVGMQTWELQIVAALQAKVPVELLVPIFLNENPDEKCAWVRNQFGLSCGERIHLLASDVGEHKHILMKRRDRAIVEMADRVFPLAIRPGGTLGQLITKYPEGKVDERFLVPHSREPNRVSYSLDPDFFSDQLRQLSTSYLIHWTRAANGPWPDETLANYYRAILGSVRYPRGGFDTLRHILSTERIRSSNRHMPKGVLAVAFSGRAPEEMATLMRWRSRYRQMSFEPYGIGIEKKWALDNGIQPVQYVETISKGTPDEAQWLLQSKGSISDWRNEDEYRHLGDFRLCDVPPEKLIAFCRSPLEAEKITREFGLRTIPFSDEVQG